MAATPVRAGQFLNPSPQLRVAAPIPGVDVPITTEVPQPINPADIGAPVVAAPVLPPVTPNRIDLEALALEQQRNEEEQRARLEIATRPPVAPNIPPPAPPPVMPQQMDAPMTFAPPSRRDDWMQPTSGAGGGSSWATPATPALPPTGVPSSAPVVTPPAPPTMGAPMPNGMATPTAPTPPAPPQAPKPPGTASPLPRSTSILDVGMTQVGKPYVWGGGRGEDISGFDCSGFVAWVFKQFGKDIPAFTDTAFEATMPVDRPMPGDLVFFSTPDYTQPGVRFPHMGIYAGNGMMLDAAGDAGVGVHPIRQNAIYRRVPGVAEQMYVPPGGPPTVGNPVQGPVIPGQGALPPEDDPSSTFPVYSGTDYNEMLTKTEAAITSLRNTLQDMVNRGQLDADVANQQLAGAYKKANQAVKTAAGRTYGGHFEDQELPPPPDQWEGLQGRATPEQKAAEWGEPGVGQMASEWRSLPFAFGTMSRASNENIPAPTRATFEESLGRGVDMAQQMGYAAVEWAGELTGNKELTNLGSKGRLAEQAEIDAVPPGMRLDEINTMGDLGQFIKETVGEQIPIMVPSVVGSVGIGGAGAIGARIFGRPILATLGAVIGAFLPSEAMSIGETQAQMKQDNPDAVAPGWVFAGGSAIAALDSVLPGYLGTKLARKVGRQAANEIITNVMAKEAPGLVRRTAKGFAEGVVTEGFTEALQEAIGAYAASAGSGKPVETKSLITNMLESGVSGSIMGGGMSGVTSALDRPPAPPSAITRSSIPVDTGFNDPSFEVSQRGQQVGQPIPVMGGVTPPATWQEPVEATIRGGADDVPASATDQPAGWKAPDLLADVSYVSNTLRGAAAEYGRQYIRWRNGEIQNPPRLPSGVTDQRARQITKDIDDIRTEHGITKKTATQGEMLNAMVGEGRAQIIPVGGTPKPAASAEPTTTTPKEIAGHTHVGQNALGHDLYEDENGVRISVDAKGRRSGEMTSTAFIPGVGAGRTKPAFDGHDEKFRTPEELGEERTQYFRDQDAYINENLANEREGLRYQKIRDREGMITRAEARLAGKLGPIVRKREEAALAQTRTELANLQEKRGPGEEYLTTDAQRSLEYKYEDVRRKRDMERFPLGTRVMYQGKEYEVAHVSGSRADLSVPNSDYRPLSGPVSLNELQPVTPPAIAPREAGTPIHAGDVVLRDDMPGSTFDVVSIDKDGIAMLRDRNTRRTGYKLVEGLTLATEEGGTTNAVGGTDTGATEAGSPSGTATPAADPVQANARYTEANVGNGEGAGGAVGSGGVSADGEQSGASLVSSQTASVLRDVQRLTPEEVHVELTNLSSDIPGVPSDYVMNAEELQAWATPVPRWNNNVYAVREAIAWIKAGRPPVTEAQRDIAAKFSGWGGSEFSQAFPEEAAIGRPTNAGSWGDRGRELHDLIVNELGREEYDSIISSRQNAFFTPPEVIASMYKALSDMGLKDFTQPRILEPSIGSGRFFGLMDTNIAANAIRSAAERDIVTGALAQMLFPNAYIFSSVPGQIKSGFEDMPIRLGTQDLVISNVPFGEIAVTDPRYTKLLKSRIHNYFFVHGMATLRPGGMLAFITSHGTMDASDDVGRAVREHLYLHADMVGMVRIPRGALPGTEVVTDIVFLRKRLPSETPGDRSWVTTERTPLVIPSTANDRYPSYRNVNINQYFLDHPEMVLGENDLKGSMRGALEYSVSPRDGQDTIQLMNEALATFPKGIFKPATTDEEIIRNAVLASATNLREGSYAIQEDGSLKQVVNGHLVKAELRGKGAEEAVKKMLGIHDAAQNVLALQRQRGADTDLRNAQRALSDAYDAFVKEYGPIGRVTNERLIRRDPAASILRALEKTLIQSKLTPDEYKEIMSAKSLTKEQAAKIKADLFTQRVMNGEQEATAATLGDAFNASLSRNGRLDFEYMGKLLGRTAIDVRADLARQNLVFHNPMGEWEPAAEYLQGDVRGKLKTAIAMSQQANGAGYLRNVEALKQVIPADLTPVDIAEGHGFNFGAPWIPAEDLNAFLTEEFEPNEYSLPTYTYNKTLAKWIKTGRFEPSEGKNLAYRAYIEGHWSANMDANEIIDRMLTNSDLKAIWEDSDGGKHTDEEVTKLVNAKAQEIRDRFEKWVLENPERADALAAIYNDHWNSMVSRHVDGEYLQFPTMDPKWAGWAEPHQKAGVARIIQDRKAGIFHEVGAGKTFVIVSASMELKRMGLSPQNIIVVPKLTNAQFINQYKDIYPYANLLYPENESAFQGGNRQVFLNRIATGDFDAVILSMEQMKAIPLKNETVAEYLREQIQELKESWLAERAANPNATGRGSAQNQLQAQIDQLTTKLREIMARIEAHQDEDIIHWEDLGVTTLFVDEAHYYKAIPWATSRTRVRGISSRRSQRGTDLHMKSRFTLRANNGRGLVLATGTPVDNTIAELYTMQRLLQEDQMEEKGVKHLDAWINTFASIESAREFNQLGNQQDITRLRKLINVPELSHLAQQVMDFVVAKETPEIAKKLPQVILTNIDAPRSPLQQQITEELEKRIAALQGQPPGGYDNHLLIGTEAALAAIDPRLIKRRVYELNDNGDPEWDGSSYEYPYADAPENPNSKINVTANVIYDRYVKSTPEKGTILGFLDVGTPKAEDLDALAGKVKGPKRRKNKKFGSSTVKVTMDVAAWLMDQPDAVLIGYMKSAYGKNGDGNYDLANAAEDVYFNRKELQEQMAEERAAEIARLREEDPDAEIDTDSEDEKRMSESLYKELTDKLVKLGIPREEIEWIHTADTPEKKNALSDAMNAGRIRVLIGSRSKAGVGLNVQERGGFIVNIDVPKTPAWYNQGVGRFVRQGNKYGGPTLDANRNVLDIGRGVEIINIIVPQSGDTSRYNNLYHKLAGTIAIMSKNVTDRSLDDIDEVVAMLGESMGFASGSEDAMKMMKLIPQMSSLQLLERSHANGVQEARRKVASLPAQITAQQKDYAKALEDAELASSTNTTFTVMGQQHDTQRKAGDALVAAVKGLPYSDTDFTAIGTYKGLVIQAKKDREVVQKYDSEGRQLKTPIYGDTYDFRFRNPKYPNDVMRGRFQVAEAELSFGVATRIHNQMKVIIDWADDERVRTEGMIKSYHDYQAMMSKPFERMAELEAITAEVARLQRNIDNMNNPNYVPEEEVAIPTDEPDLGTGMQARLPSGVWETINKKLAAQVAAAERAQATTVDMSELPIPNPENAPTEDDGRQALLQQFYDQLAQVQGQRQRTKDILDQYAAPAETTPTQEAVPPPVQNVTPAGTTVAQPEAPTAAASESAPVAPAEETTPALTQEAEAILDEDDAGTLVKTEKAPRKMRRIAKDNKVELPKDATVQDVVDALKQLEQEVEAVATPEEPIAEAPATSGGGAGAPPRPPQQPPTAEAAPTPEPEENPFQPYEAPTVEQQHPLATQWDAMSLMDRAQLARRAGLSPSATVSKPWRSLTENERFVMQDWFDRDAAANPFAAQATEAAPAPAPAPTAVQAPAPVAEPTVDPNSTGLQNLGQGVAGSLERTWVQRLQQYPDDVMRAIDIAHQGWDKLAWPDRAAIWAAGRGYRDEESLRRATAVAREVEAEIATTGEDPMQAMVRRLEQEFPAQQGSAEATATEPVAEPVAEPEPAAAAPAPGKGIGGVGPEFGHAKNMRNNPNLEEAAREALSDPIIRYDGPRNTNALYDRAKARIAKDGAERVYGEIMAAAGHSEEDVAAGQILERMLTAENTPEATAKFKMLVTRLAQTALMAGRISQAFAISRRLDPEAQYRRFSREVFNQAEGVGAERLKGRIFNDAIQELNEREKVETAQVDRELEVAKGEAQDLEEQSDVAPLEETPTSKKQRERLRKAVGTLEDEIKAVRGEAVPVDDFLQEINNILAGPLGGAQRGALRISNPATMSAAEAESFRRMAQEIAGMEPGTQRDSLAQSLKEALNERAREIKEQHVKMQALKKRNAKKGATDDAAPPKADTPGMTKRIALERVVFQLGNEGRLPKVPRTEHDLYRMLRLANETGWLLPHNETEAILDLIQEAKRLPKVERAVRLDEIFNMLRDTYLPALERRSVNYKQVKALATRGQKLVDEIGSWGRNPKMPATTNAEAITIRLIRTTMNEIGFVAPPELMDTFQQAWDDVNMMEVGPRQVQAAKNLIQWMGDTLLPTLLQVKETMLREKMELRQRANDIRTLSGKAHMGKKAKIKEAHRQGIEAAKRLRAAKGFDFNDVQIQKILAMADRVRRLEPDSKEQYMAMDEMAAYARSIVPPARYQYLINIMGVPRMLKTMWDLSAPFRQGKWGGITHPIIWASEWIPMIHAFIDGSYARDVDATIRTRPMAARAERAKLRITPRDGTFGGNEEQFFANMAGFKDVKGFRNWAMRFIGPNASNDAYVTFLNKLRADWFDYEINRAERGTWLRKGVKLTPAEDAEIAHNINVFTGYGDLGPLEKGANIAAFAFFSPRYWAAEIEAPLIGLRGVASVVIPGYRQLTESRLSPEFLHASRVAGFQAGSTLGALLAGFVTMAGFVIANGGEVELDPLKGDFGQIKFRGQRYNPLGAQAQLIRTLARFKEGGYRTSSGTFRPQDRRDIFGGYIRTKLEPFTGFLNSLWLDQRVQGGKIIGQPVPEGSVLSGLEKLTGFPLTEMLGQQGGIANEFAQMMIMGIFNDGLEAYDQEGITGGATAALASGVGLGVQTYETRADAEDKAAMDLFGVHFWKMNDGEGPTKGEREAINQHPLVLKQNAAYGDTRHDDPQELADNATTIWVDGKKNIQNQFAEKVLPFLPPTGRQRTDAIKQLKRDRRVLAENTLQNATVQEAFKARGERRQTTDDALAEAYWSTPLEMKSNGDPNFTDWNRKRREILDRAPGLGVDVEYITGIGKYKAPDGSMKNTYRGTQYDNPQVQKAIEEYEERQTIVREYYGYVDLMKATYPQMAEMLEVTELARASGNFAVYNKMLQSRAHEAWSEMTLRWRMAHPEVQKAGEELGYFTPIRAPAGRR